MNIANKILKKILWIWKMTREEYVKLCSSYGMFPSFKESNKDTDYGFYVNNTEFMSVCGYRSKENPDKDWEDGSMIFYNDNGFYRDEYYTDCKKSIPSLIKEIEKVKMKINLYRKKQIERDFV